MSARVLGGLAVPMTPLTPVTLSLLTNQKNPGVEAYTPRTRGLHAELQSWLSPLIGDGEPEASPKRKPPARLPQLTEEERDFGESMHNSLLTADWNGEHTSSPSSGAGADPLNASQLAAEAVLESLMQTVVDETDAKFAAAREGSDLAAELAVMARDVDSRLTAKCAKAITVSVKDVMAMVKGYIVRAQASCRRL